MFPTSIFLQYQKTMMNKGYIPVRMWVLLNMGYKCCYKLCYLVIKYILQNKNIEADYFGQLNTTNHVTIYETTI